MMTTWRIVRWPTVVILLLFARPGLRACQRDESVLARTPLTARDRAAELFAPAPEAVTPAAMVVQQAVAAASIVGTPTLSFVRHDIDSTRSAR
jgi:hypothetical protein